MTYSEFWRDYLRDHRTKSNVALHGAGTFSAVAMLIAAAWMRSWLLALGAIGVGYGLAWIGHFIFERNKPAAFNHPVWSLISDLRLMFLLATGQLQSEYMRHET